MSIITFLYTKGHAWECLFFVFAEVLVKKNIYYTITKHNQLHTTSMRVRSFVRFVLILSNSCSFPFGRVQLWENLRVSVCDVWWVWLLLLLLLLNNVISESVVRFFFLSCVLCFTMYVCCTFSRPQPTTVTNAVYAVYGWLARWLAGWLSPLYTSSAWPTFETATLCDVSKRTKQQQQQL